MKTVFHINEKIAPKEWSKFKPWHKAAAGLDPLTAEERFVKLGGKIPKDKKNDVDNKRTNKKK